MSRRSNTAEALDCRLAMTVLVGALAVVYAIAGATLVGTVPRSGVVLLTISAVQAVVAVCLTRGAGKRALIFAATVELSLAGAWLASRSVGLPSVHPIGLADSLVTLDELLVVLLAAGLAGYARPAGVSAQLALMLAAVSVTVLAAGHTHTPSASAAGRLPAGAPQHLYCRLL